MDQEIHFHFSHETLEMRIEIWNLDENIQAQFHKAILSILLLARSFYVAVLKDREKSLTKNDSQLLSLSKQDLDDVIKTIKPISDGVLSSLIFEAIKKFFGL